MSIIPKIIHQIWMQGEKNIPNKYNNNIKTVKYNHKTWEYILWDEIKILELISSKKEWLDIYYKFTYLHQKIDFAKYVILFIFGGIYVDIDVEIVKSFDSLISEFNNADIIVSKLNINSTESFLATGYNESYNNGIIISKKNGEVIKKLIDEILISFFKSDLHFKVLYINSTTGPRIFTKVINDNKNKVNILPSEYLEPCTRGNCNITEKTIAIHKHELTWMSESLKNIIDFYLENKLILSIIILIIIIYIIKK